MRSTMSWTHPAMKATQTRHYQRASHAEHTNVKSRSFCQLSLCRSTVSFEVYADHLHCDIDDTSAYAQRFELAISASLSISSHAPSGRCYAKCTKTTRLNSTFHCTCAAQTAMTTRHGSTCFVCCHFDLIHRGEHQPSK